MRKQLLQKLYPNMLTIQDLKSDYWLSNDSSLILSLLKLPGQAPMYAYVMLAVCAITFDSLDCPAYKKHTAFNMDLFFVIVWVVITVLKFIIEKEKKNNFLFYGFLT